MVTNNCTLVIVKITLLKYTVHVHVVKKDVFFFSQFPGGCCLIKLCHARKKSGAQHEKENMEEKEKEGNGRRQNGGIIEEA